MLHIGQIFIILYVVSTMTIFYKLKICGKFIKLIFFLLAINANILFCVSTNYLFNNQFKEVVEINERLYGKEFIYQYLIHYNIQYTNEFRCLTSYEDIKVSPTVTYQFTTKCNGNLVSIQDVFHINNEKISLSIKLSESKYCFVKLTLKTNKFIKLYRCNIHQFVTGYTSIYIYVCNSLLSVVILPLLLYD